MKHNTLWLVLALVGALLSGCIAPVEGSQPAATTADALVNAAWLTENLDNPNVRVIEVSVAPGVYENGHIPGALNIPWGQNVNEDGTFKSVEELRALYAGFGVDGSKPLITYCRIGERAALTWFVLHQLLGYDAALYDGSWTEYGNTVAVPIKNPAGTIWGAQ